MATYILRNFDKSLAITGFRCIMLTGSHFAGSLIADSDSDIKCISTSVTSAYNEVQLKDNEVQLKDDDTTYTFDSTGKCITLSKYRLMLADNTSSGTIEEMLSNICNAIILLNETVNSYCEGISKKFETIQEEIDELRSKIPDISGLASEEYVDGAIEEVNGRISSYHPNNEK